MHILAAAGCALHPRQYGTQTAPLTTAHQMCTVPATQQLSPMCAKRASTRTLTTYSRGSATTAAIIVSRLRSSSGENSTT